MSRYLYGGLEERRDEASSGRSARSWSGSTFLLPIRKKGKEEGKRKEGGGDMRVFFFFSTP